MEDSSFTILENLEGTAVHLMKLLKLGGVLCAIREHVIWSEEQRQRFLANHPLHHITQSEGAYYLKEYRNAFLKAGLEISLELHPYASIINTFPQDLDDIRRSMTKRLPKLLRPVIRMEKVDILLRRLAAWYMARKTAQLYSFFAKKEPLSSQLLLPNVNVVGELLHLFLKRASTKLWMHMFGKLPICVNGAGGGILIVAEKEQREGEK